MDQTDERQPPPLFDNVDITNKEDDDDDLFTSAVQEVQSLEESTNGFEESIDDSLRSKPTTVPPVKVSEMESIPINASSNQSAVMRPNDVDGGDTFIEITITEPQKIGDGMGAYLAYKVATRTNMPLFKKRSNSVMRRFSDFLGLHDKLTEKYLRAGRIIPPAPEKSVIGMTKIKISSQSSMDNASGPTPNGSSADWVERRRAALERYLNRTARHPVLCVDPDFRDFLENESELPKASGTAALSGAGVMRLFNKVGETVNKITYRMDETDPWFEERTQQVEALDAQLRKLHTSVENLVQHRRDLCTLSGGTARALATLSSCEEHTGLSRVLNQLADVEEKVEILRSEQANSDFFILSEMLKDYIGLFGAVKEVFHERVKVFQNWQHSQYQLTKKRENKAKLELSGRTDRVDQAGVEVLEWESKVERGQEEFDNISKMIRKELDRLEVTRVKEFKDTVIKYLEDHMAHQQQLVKYWEGFLPEAKAIS